MMKPSEKQVSGSIPAKVGQTSEPTELATWAEKHPDVRTAGGRDGIYLVEKYPKRYVWPKRYL